jgi:hypothetical protein
MFEKSDMKEVHNLKYSHCMGVVAYRIGKYFE